MRIACSPSTIPDVVALILLTLSISTSISCGDDDDNTTAGQGGSSTPASCTDLEPGPVVEQIAVAEDPPPPSGGTASEGTYVLTGDKLFTGPDGQSGPTGVSHKGATRVTGNRVEIVQDSLKASGTFELAGTTMTVNATCPFEFTTNAGFTAEGNTIQTYSTKGDNIQTFTLVE